MSIEEYRIISSPYSKGTRIALHVSPETWTHSAPLDYESWLENTLTTLQIQGDLIGGANFESFSQKLTAVNAVGGVRWSLVEKEEEVEPEIFYIFTESGTFSNLGTYDVIVVGGGGGGASGWWSCNCSGGGGGAGGVLLLSNIEVTEPISVVIGSGGRGSVSGNTQLSGNNSSFGEHVALGGGRGGGYWGNGTSALNSSTGGSGGGGFNASAGATGTSGQGHNGVLS